MVRDRAALSFFLILVVGGGLAVGYLTAPGEWYGQLAKPAFNPPNCSGRFGQSSTF
jgi:tryptophan-rich sensory protein